MVLDVGSGPGCATLDLLDVVGPGGRIVAIDQSERFLAFLRAQGDERRLGGLDTVCADLSTYEFPAGMADGAWLRWVLAFVREPRRVLEGVVRALRPGGRIALHEYFAYETWKPLPRDRDFKAFVAAVMSSWRERGGEPNIALEIPGWLEGMGVGILATRTIVELVTARDARWRWPVAFARSGIERLVQLGDVSGADAERMRASIRRLETAGGWMITPAVAEMVARKPA